MWRRPIDMCIQSLSQEILNSIPLTVGSFTSVVVLILADSRRTSSEPSCFFVLRSAIELGRVNFLGSACMWAPSWNGAAS